MKLFEILLTCCLVQGLIGENADDKLKSGNEWTIISDLLSGKKLTSRAESHGNTNKTVTPVVCDELDLSSITALLQDVFLNIGSMNLSSLSNSVNSAFKCIISTLHLLSSEVKENDGPTDVALGGVNFALSNLIDTVLASRSATVRKLSTAIDKAIDKIIKALAVLVRAVKGIIKLIVTVTSIVYSGLQATLKTITMVVLTAFKTVQTHLDKNDLFVTLLLSTVVKTLSKDIIDWDVSTPININKIVKELSQCSAGTILEFECVSRTLDGSSNDVDIVVTGISVSPPCKAEWADSLNELKSSISHSFDEIIYTCESATKALTGWSEEISPAIINNHIAILGLIDAALLASGGKSEKLEPAIINIALGVQSILNALGSIIGMAKKQHSKLVSNALKSIEHACYTDISIVYNIFFAVSVAIDGSVSSKSILPALTAALEVGIDGNPSELLEIRPAIDYICDK